MPLLDMGSKTEGTIRRRFLSLRVAVALSPFGIAQCQESGEDLTVSGTKTVHVSSTSTITIPAHSASAIPSRNMPKGEVYILQGCYRPNAVRSLDTMLGEDATNPNGTARDGMSLSACLDLCKLPALPETQSEQEYSLYVGLSNGKDCYCGGSLDTTVEEVKSTNCTLPCPGNNAIACGGRGHMLIYKLSTSTTPGDKHGDGPYDDNSGNGGKPGLIAGVVLGSISGFALLVFLIFYGARMVKRRRQRRAHGSDENGTGPGDLDEARDTIFSGSAKANKTDQRDADPIVTDFAPSAGERRPSNSVRHKEILAASTGADWRAGNPETPRAAVNAAPMKQLVTNGPHDDKWEDIPNTPTILVRQPESVAQNPGLGDRAWHRRRLSAPFPPPGHRYSDSSMAFGGAGGPERAAEDAPSQGVTDGTSTPWEDDWNALMPAPLTLQPLGHHASGGSVSLAEDGGPLTEESLWTVGHSDASLSGSSGASLEGDWRTGRKIGKTE
ncbi:hypothetical protein KVR01_003426 [Diaporthe batatas]|uniref:uncharacterized protein n=1 Tax=Diaporthe batatas TaxID=748121 RepID=UPI001D05C10C|nr:uncharacterized protein KVR01_003426 [Diaporthe batatas]KAG8167737.1 hypothetical protein KVR01_003426 [Diaporthe batatas]